jgi:DNA-binding SARP family transcriptional activator
MGTDGAEWGTAQRGNNNAPSRARTALSEALAELRRLTQDPLFAGVERALASLGNTPIEPEFAVETVRRLQQWSAEHQRVAIELEAAARCCRLVEREITQQVDALLERPSAKTRRRTAPLREMFRRGRVGSQPVEEWRESAVREPELTLVSTASMNDYPVPDADIAASALGPLEVRVAGQRDVLMALQWPDHSRNSARNNLNVALYSLRNTLDGLGQGAQPVVYRDGCYILNPDLTWWVDRTEFLSAVDEARRARRAGRLKQVIGAYRKAVRLYRGPLFEDDGAGEWYLPEQRRLRDLYGQALEEVAEIQFECGELSEALHFGQLAISNDPCSEANHRLLMRCYASQHQQQLLSRQYRVCAAALHDELGVSPSDETTRLFHALT